MLKLLKKVSKRLSLHILHTFVHSCGLWYPLIPLSPGTEAQNSSRQLSSSGCIAFPCPEMKFLPSYRSRYSDTGITSLARIELLSLASVPPGFKAAGLPPPLRRSVHLQYCGERTGGAVSMMHSLRSKTSRSMLDGSHESGTA